MGHILISAGDKPKFHFLNGNSVLGCFSLSAMSIIMIVQQYLALISGNTRPDKLVIMVGDIIIGIRDDTVSSENCR